MIRLSITIDETEKGRGLGAQRDDEQLGSEWEEGVHDSIIQLLNEVIARDVNFDVLLREK